MGFIHPTRRELLAGIPVALGAIPFAKAATCEAVGTLASAGEGLRFIVVGDWGRQGKQGQRETADAMARVGHLRKTSFVVSTGDNFYTFGVRSTTDRHWRTSFADIYDPKLGSWYITLGNHDYGGNVDAQIARNGHFDGRWQLPDRWHEKLFVTAGLPMLHLFFFDTVSWIGKESWWWGLHGDRPTFESQKRQLKEMSERIERSPPGSIKIAFGHHGIYSIGKHGGEMKMKELDDLLRHFGFSAYVSGHDHCMYHITHRGMHYVCSGAGSQILSQYTGGPEAQRCVVAPYCDPIDATSPRFPRWERFLARTPHNPETHIDGGFAVFELDRLGVNFEFFNSGTCRGYDPVRIALHEPKMASLLGRGFG